MSFDIDSGILLSYFACGKIMLTKVEYSSFDLYIHEVQIYELPFSDLNNHGKHVPKTFITFQIWE
jgi:hypothetical protein